MNQVVITKWKNTKFLLIYEDDKLAECHPIIEDTSLRIGNIYIGRVEKVVKNIQSAFIRLDQDHVGYLPLNDKPALILNRTLPKGLPSIAENDLILVQVEQESQKMKQARVTGNINLTGEYVSLDLMKGIVGVSKKIKNTDRIEQLKKLLSDSNLGLENEELQRFGCIFRTACEEAENQDIISEYLTLSNKMNTIVKKATYERKTGCIMEGKKEYLAILEEYGISRIDEVKTDISEIYEELKNVYSNIRFYDSQEYPLCKMFSVETEIGKLLNKKVWLKSGGFLVIEPTEAMVVIDVNSGKSIGKKKKETHIFETNLEAAKEIVRQLRLRNLSGIIMVDFINMEDAEHQRQIVSCIEQGLRKDKIPGYFVEITKLGVYELTRKKVRKPIHEILR